MQTLLVYCMLFPLPIPETWTPIITDVDKSYVLQSLQHGETESRGACFLERLYAISTAQQTGGAACGELSTHRYLFLFLFAQDLFADMQTAHSSTNTKAVYGSALAHLRA